MNAPGRPLEFDPQAAMDAAMEVFWCRGYEAASMAELLAAMQLSKSSMYQSFGSKEGLFQCCLDRYAGLQADALRGQLAQAASGRGFIQALFAGVAETAERPEGAKGCLMVNSAGEFGQRDPVVALTLGTALHPISALFVQAIERAQREGEIAPDADAAALAGYMHVAIGGLRTMIKAGMDRPTAQATVRLLLKALD